MLSKTILNSSSVEMIEGKEVRGYRQLWRRVVRGRATVMS